MTYVNLVVEPGAPLLADLALAVDGDFQILLGDRVIFAEPSFPVAELASSLFRWVKGGRGEFTFESMSYEEEGTVMIRRTDLGWVVGSVFTPDVVSSPVPWSDVEACVLAFVSDLERDLGALGLDSSRLFLR